MDNREAYVFFLQKIIIKISKAARKLPKSNSENNSNLKYFCSVSLRT